MTNYEQKDPCWIIWEINRITRDSQIRGIMTTESQAKYAVEAIKNEANSLGRESRIYAERRFLNHLYGHGMYFDEDENLRVGGKQ